MPTAIDRLEAFLADGRLHQASDLAEMGITRVALQRASALGRVTLYTRGVYCANDLVGTPGLGIAAMTLRYPEAVACMFTAAQWHDLSDEDPPEIWLAIPRSRTRKTIQGPPSVRTVWWDGADMTAGVETITVAGVPIRITDRARTVVDLVRHRGKTGDEPAMKALHDYVRTGGSMGLLWERAKQVGAQAHLEPFVKAAEEFSESIPVRGP